LSAARSAGARRRACRVQCPHAGLQGHAVERAGELADAARRQLEARPRLQQGEPDLAVAALVHCVVATARPRLHQRDQALPAAFGHAGSLLRLAPKPLPHASLQSIP
jgi:hypothetical protein